MINGVAMKVQIDDLLLQALKEDITNEDITTNAILQENKIGEAQLLCKENGVLAGISVFHRVFQLLDTSVRMTPFFQDGDKIKNGDTIATLTGDMKVILSGERVALNYLQRMCGIATYTKSLVNELKGSHTKLLDTRKTTPNFRIFEKYAVKIGGGSNHRYNLSDGILIKDNHIGAAGSISKAVALAKQNAPFVRKIEVETENLEMVKEALSAGADIIMLDNMSTDMLKQAVALIQGKAETECSGNITKSRLKELSEIGLDFISCGALTHSASILDLSLKNLKPME